MEGKEGGPEGGEGEAHEHAGAEGYEDAGERADEEIFGEVAVAKIFGADEALGGNEKGQSRVAAGGNDDGENEALEIADQAATVDFDEIDEFGSGFGGCWFGRGRRGVGLYIAKPDGSFLRS